MSERSIARLARRFHALVGWAAVVMALCHLVAVSWVGRARDVRWLGVELLVGVLVLLPGWWMVRSARRLRLGGSAAPAIAATVILAGVSIQQLFTWRATFPAVFALLAAVDGLALSFLPRRWWAKTLCVLLFVALAAVAAGVYLLAGGGDLIEP